jgi:Zn-dependent protease with chaperone function
MRVKLLLVIIAAAGPGVAAAGCLGAAAADAVPQFVVTDAMREHSRIRYLLYFAGSFYSMALLVFLLGSAVVAKVEDRARSIKSVWLVQFTVFFLVFCLLLFVLKLPLYYYSGFHLSHQFGMSAMSFSQWLEDLLKAQLFNGVIAWFLSACALWVVARFPRRWWLVLWSASIPLPFLAVFLMPLVFDPMFNKYTLMEPSPLKDKIVAIAVKAGIPEAPIFVVDKSKQTRTYNAYVTGLGGTARIVLWDTIFKLPEDELLAIVGHEAGHYALQHIIIGSLSGVGGSFLLFFAAGRLLPLALSKLPARWGLQSSTSFAMVPLAFLFGNLVLFIADPFVNAVSRELEKQADGYSLAMTGDGTALARTFVSLSKKNLSDPDPPPFVEFWSFSHPSLRRRLNQALAGEARETSP